jgi:hypothetical protein
LGLELDIERESFVAKDSKKLKSKIGTLVSKLNQPEIIQYGAEEIRVSPRAKIKNIDGSLLGVLPKGISFIASK